MLGWRPPALVKTLRSARQNDPLASRPRRLAAVNRRVRLLPAQRGSSEVRWHHERPFRPHGEGGDCFIGGVTVERIWTTDLSRHVGERVRLAGWLHRLRQLSGVSFLILRDGKGLAQIV